MKKYSFPFLFISVFCTLIMLLSGCSKPGKLITVATDASWPPMEYLDRDSNEITGFDIDLMKAIAAHSGFEVRFVNHEWAGIFDGLAASEYDAVISSVTITVERMQLMDFSVPYINAGQVLIVHTDADDSVARLADLEGMIVGAQSGTTGAGEIRKVSGIQLREYEVIETAIKDLCSKNIAGVVADTPTAANFVLKNETYAGKLKITGNAFTNELYGIAVKKGNAELLDMINNGITYLSNSGFYRKLEEKWLH